MSLPGSMSRVLGYVFRNQELLEKALTHASYAHETGCSGDNERLEYLGDAVLGLVIARDLYAAHPDWNEGQLTREIENGQLRLAEVNVFPPAKVNLAINLKTASKIGLTLPAEIIQSASKVYR